VALASGPNTRKLFLWKWRDQEPREVAVPAHRIDGVGFSPDGKVLAGIEDFGSLFAWEVASGRLLFRQDSSDDEFSFLGKPVFTSDGKTLAVRLRARRSTFRGKVQCFDPLTGRAKVTLETGTTGAGLAFAPDSRTLAVTSGCGVRLWDTVSRQEVTATRDAHESYPSSIIVSPKGFLVTAGDDGSVRVWDAATTRQRWKSLAEHWVRAVALSPDGSLVAASSLEDTVYVLDSRAGRQIYRLAGHGQMGGRRMLSFLPDSKGLLSFGDDFYLRLWDMKTGKARFEHAIRPSGVTIPEGDGDDIRTGKQEFMMQLGEAVVPPDARTFVLDVAGDYHVFDIKGGKEKTKFPSASSFSTHTAVSPDGKRLLASAWGSYQIENHPVMLVDAASGKVVQRWVLPSSVSGPVAFSADGRVFATALEEPNRQILVYEIASGKVRCTVQGYRSRVWSLAFFPDSRRLASGQSDSTVLIWDVSALEHTRKGP
jgi:WD40 repeat protein